MSDIVLRYYQEESIDNCITDLELGHNPVIGLPTGSGKSIVLCGLAERIIDNDVHANVLVLSHVKEILEQNLKALKKYFFGMKIGLFCAGLNSKTISKITVASIQTVKNCPEKFRNFTYVIIDEAHRVGFDHKTGYRKFINRIKAQSIGLTATPFRMKGGYIYKGKDALFDKLSIDMTSGERFEKLIREGYLSEIYSKNTVLSLSDTNIKSVAGDFSTKDLSDKFDRDHITEGAILECIHFGKNYHHWLCFAIDIKHSENIAARANAHGISAIAVHSKMDGRDKAIADFKNGKYKLMVNVDILTTGFDFPSIDMIIMLRHTKSPIIHVQTIGRGLRPFYKEGMRLETKEQRLEAINQSTKTHCLVLDFAGNARRLGPINDVKVILPGEKIQKGGTMMKSCKECGIDNPLPAKFCCNCGFEFITKEKIKQTADNVDLVKKKNIKEEKAKAKKNPPTWANVTKVSYRKFAKNNKDMALIIDYKCGLAIHSDFIFIQGGGYSRFKALNWIKQRWTSNHLSAPTTVKECIANSQCIKQPKRILIDSSGKYIKIIRSEF